MTIIPEIKILPNFKVIPIIKYRNDQCNKYILVFMTSTIMYLKYFKVFKWLSYMYKYAHMHIYKQMQLKSNNCHPGSRSSDKNYDNISI